MKEKKNNFVFNCFFFLKMKRKHVKMWNQYNLWKMKNTMRKKIKNILINIFIIYYIWFYILIFINIKYCAL